MKDKDKAKELMGEFGQSKEVGQRYRTTLDGLLEGCQIIDADWRYVYLNDAAAKHSRRPKKELLGRTMMEAYPGIEKTEMFKQLKLCMEKRVHRRMENEFSYPNGSKGWFDLSFEPVPEGVFILSVDITEHKKAEEKLREVEAFRSGLLANSPTPIAVVDADSMVRYVNPAMVRLTGFSAEELTGEKAPYSYWPREDHFKIMKGFRKAMRQGGERVVELFQKKNGEKFRVEITSVVVKKNGKFQYLLSNWVDITERKKAEEALKESEHYLRKAQQTAHFGSWVLDVKTNRVEFSDEMFNIFGITKEQFTGAPEYTNKLVVPKDRARVQERYKDLLIRRKPVSMEYSITRPDGSMRHLWGNGDVELDEKGNLQRLVGTVLDITERKLAEEELQTIIKTALDGFWLTNLEGKILEVNDSYCRMVGYTREELLKMSISDLEAIESPEEVAGHIKTIIEQGYGSFESRHKRKDGKIIDVEISVNYLDVDEGQLFVFARDITERKRAEDALRESEARYRAVIEGAQDMIQSVGFDGSIIFVNKSWLDTLGYAEAELSDLNFFEIVHPDSQAHCREIISEVAKGKPIHSLEAAFLTKDGQRILIGGNAAPRYIGSKVVAAHCVFRDITERKRAGEELQASEEKFYKAFHATSNLMAIASLETGKIIDVNEAYARLVGYKREEIIGQTELALDLSIAQEQREEIEKRLREKGTVHDFEVEILTKSGGIRTVLLSADTITLKGEPCLINTAIDITDRKRAEQLQRGENYVLTLLGRGAKLSKLLDAIVRLGEQNDPSIKGSVLLFDPSKSGEMLLQASGPSLPDDYKVMLEAGIPIGPKAGSCGTAAYRKERVVIPDIAKDPLFKPFEEVVKRTVENNLLAVWSQPIIASNGELLGTIANYSSKVGEPSADNLRVLEWSARIAAIAIERRRAEDTLRESEEKFYKAFHASSNLMGIATIKTGRVIDINEAYARLTGYTREEILGHTSLELNIWANAEQREEVVKRLKEEGTVNDLEVDVLTKSGEIRTVLFSADTITLKGEPCLINMAIDITERKQAEEALMESDAFQSSLLANSPIPVSVINPDSSVRFVNPAMVKLTGFSAAELTGEKAPYCYWPKEESAKIMKRFKKAMRQGGERVLELFQKKNGDKFWVEITSVAVKKDGKFQYLLVSWVDITERRQAEEALRESEAFSSSLLSNSPIPMLVINPDTSLRYVNQALKELTGFSAAEVIGRKAPYPWWTEETLQKTKGDLAGAMSKGAVRLEELFKKKNGERFWVEITSTSVRQDGEFKYYLANWVDITERKQAEEEVVRLARFPSENPTPVMRVDQDGAVLYANKAALPLLNEWKCQVGQLLPKYWREFTLNVLNSGSRKDVEVNVGKRVFTVTFSPVTGEGYVNLYGLDITERKQAEEALRESEARYRAVIEGAHDMIQSVGLDGGIIFVNKAWLDTLGYTEAELSDLNLFDIIHSDSQKQCREMMTEVAKGKPVQNIGATFLTKDGRMILVEGSAAPRYIGNKVVASQGIFRDVTERKRAEAALADEATRNRILIDESSDGIVILDEDGKVYEANRRFAEMLGYTPEEARELSVWDWEFQFPREQVAEMIRTVDETGDHFETRHRRKDGSTFDVEISTNGAVYAGQKLIFCVCRDITARKQAEAALRESEEKYKNLVGATSDIIWETDAEARFTFISPKVKDILGYRVDEVVGKKRTLDLVPKGQFRKWLKRFKELNAKKEPFFGLEIPHLHKNGRQVIFETSGIPLFDGEGKLKGYVGINRDITERRQMQEQLVITDRLASVGELAAGIAHELNNPLTGVIGFSQLLMGKEVPDDVHEDLQAVYSEAQRASQVVKNLLTFARKHTAAKEKVNINDIINKVLELRAYEQNLENIKVDARLDSALPKVMADYFQLQQVFLNIIINAEYFMKEAHNKGTLTITTEEVGNKVKASFADDGPGIAKGDLGHLFDPFFTTKEVGKGTGLGLSICHGIIAEHGGRIYVESELGKGATFIVELPIGAAEDKGSVA